LDSISRRTPHNRQLSAAHHLFKGGDSSTQLTYSPDDLLLMDKSMRNSMLQDLVSFKKQLIRLRRILQEVCVCVFYFIFATIVHINHEEIIYSFF